MELDTVKTEVSLLAARFFHVLFVFVGALVTLPWFILLALMEWFRIGKDIHTANWPKGD
jgi:hypothetical protein